MNQNRRPAQLITSESLATGRGWTLPWGEGMLISHGKQSPRTRIDNFAGLDEAFLLSSGRPTLRSYELILIKSYTSEKVTYL